MVGVTFNGWVKRIPVMQNGRRVGTLPTDAGLSTLCSREGDAWIAADQLDLGAVKEFERGD
jgi:hypothetical protein